MELARCLTTKTRIDAETETLIPTIGGVFSSDIRSEAPFAVRDIAGTLTSNYGKQVDSSDTALGPNVVLRPIAFDSRQECVSSTEVFGALGSSGPQAQAVAFSCKDYGADATTELAPTMRAMGHAGSHPNAGGQLAVCITGDITHTLKAEGFDASEDGTGRGQPIVAHAIQAGALRANPDSGPDGVGVQADVAYTLEARSEVQCAQMGMAVRRLTPRECERLQGFPDDYTRIPMRHYKQRRITKTRPEDQWEKDTTERGGWWLMMADGPRYKSLGNSWAVPVVTWIGARIDKALRG